MLVGNNLKGVDIDEITILCLFKIIIIKIPFFGVSVQQKCYLMTSSQFKFPDKVPKPRNLSHSIEFLTYVFMNVNFEKDRLALGTGRNNKNAVHTSGKIVDDVTLKL